MRATGVHGATTARTPPDEGRVDGRHEPEQRIHQIDPHGVLHAVDAALLGSRVCGDVDVTEEAEERDPEDTVCKS